MVTKKITFDALRHEHFTILRSISDFLNIVVTFVYLCRLLAFPRLRVVSEFYNPLSLHTLLLRGHHLLGLGVGWHWCKSMEIKWLDGWTDGWMQWKIILRGHLGRKDGWMEDRLLV